MPPENPLQKLEPVHVSFKALAKSKFPGFTRADLIGTRRPGNWLSDGIDLAQERITGQEAEVSHIMRYLGAGLCIDQQKTLQLNSLETYVGSMIRVYHYPYYTEAQQDHLVAESIVRLGDYDYWSIAGHALEALTALTGLLDGAAESLESGDVYNCSEGASMIERLVMPEFCGDNLMPMPAEIDQYCINAGWQISTLVLDE